MPKVQRKIAVGALAALLASTLIYSASVPPADAASPALTEVPGSGRGGVFASAPFGAWGALDSNATGEIWSSPAVADVTGDGVPEIIVGGLTTQVRVYATNGNLLTTIDPGGGNQSTKAGGTQAAPAIGDMNGDGVSDIVTANTGGVLSAWSYRNRTLSQIFRQEVRPEFNGALLGLFGTPALGFVDGDAALDTVTSSWGQSLDVFSGPSGTKITSSHQWLKDTIWSSPVIGDVDGDGEAEIVVGADCEGSGPPQPCYGTHGGGYVWVFNLDGSVAWSHFVANAVIWSTPALSDLNGDGTLDVVVGTGLYFEIAKPPSSERKVIALNGKTGRLLWEAPTAGAVVGSPSVGDVDGDGKPEVFAIARGGKLYSWDGENGARRGTGCVTDGSCDGSDYATHGGVALADVDGDGTVEAIVQGEQKLRVFDANSMAFENTWRSSYPRTIFASSSTPTVASVNGKAWIVVASRGSGSDNSRNDNDELVVQVWASQSALGVAPWPTFKQNMMRTGNAIAQAAPDPTSTQNFVKQLYRDFLAREATTDELNFWTNRLMNRQSDRYAVATELSRSDEWITTVISDFYRDTLGRTPDAAGLQGWIAAARNGMPVAQIASAFYSSPEYFQNVGRNDYTRWVSDLYQKLLLRAPDGGGVTGWVGALNAGMPRDTLTYGFYQSGETLGVRITALYTKLLGRAPENGAIPNWAPFVSNQGDLVLAAALAASGEYYNYAQTAH